MVLFLVIAVKLAENLNHVGVSVGAAEGIASTVEAKNEFNVFIGINSLLDMGAGSVRHIDRDWRFRRSKKKGRDRYLGLVK